MASLAKMEPKRKEAMDEGSEIPLPRGPQLGEAAPNFRARTTMGMVHLSDYRGRWLLLFSHPADFTPVCTSEFLAFTKAADRFAALNCALLAVSVDSLYSHLGWVKAIRDAFGITVSFPIVEDPSLIVGRAYGMISEQSPDAATMRSTFFIDPEGIIRATIDYPATIGRSVEEMLRVLAALQRVDRDDVLTPEGWQPGDPVLLPPHADQAAMFGPGEEPGWFCRTRPDREKE